MELEMVPPLREFLTESVQEVKTREAHALDDILNANHQRCVIFGAGTLGTKAVSLLRELGVEPLALCDSNPSRWNTKVLGLPVLSPVAAASNFGLDAVFFVTIWNDFHWFSRTRERLWALGCTSVSSYAPIFWRFGQRFMNLLLLNEPAHHLYEQQADVFKAEQLWADEESLQAYRANIVWRALGDPSHLPYPAPQNTYFPSDLFRLSPSEVVIDCGAFDGDTIQHILSLVGANFQAIHSIEADSVSNQKLSRYLATLSPYIKGKIHTVDCAVGEERSVLRFNMCGDPTSRTEDDGVDVQCIPLDELFDDKPVTLIKMDIEGAEYGSLLGARKILYRDRPVLAICVYHTQNDIWRIPLYLDSLDLKYKFFLRSYDGDGFQSVVYAVPPDRMLPEAERLSAPHPRKPIDL